MKTKKEIETINNIYDTSNLLISIFSKYKDYDSTLDEHFNTNDLFKNRKEFKAKSSNDNVAVIEYKESILKKILNKIKSLF